MMASGLFRSLLSHPAYRGLRLGIVAALAAWLIANHGVFRGMEDWLLDGNIVQRGTEPLGPEFVIIGVDEASLNALGKPLAYLSPELAKVVDYVHGQGAAAIGLDLLVPESLRGLHDIETAGGPGDARPMGRAILDAGNVVFRVAPE